MRVFLRAPGERARPGTTRPAQVSTSLGMLIAAFAFPGNRWMTLSVKRAGSKGRAACRSEQGLTAVAGMPTFNAVVVGGGPAGATAATDLASGSGDGPCSSIAPAKSSLAAARSRPSSSTSSESPTLCWLQRRRRRAWSRRRRGAVDMPIEGGFVGMVDREVFDEWLRRRAAGAGVERCSGTFDRLDRDADGAAVGYYRPHRAPRRAAPGKGEGARRDRG